jgi:hypothetical protein
VLLAQLKKSFKELNWGVLAIEILILIIGISVSLQVNEWQNQRDDRQLAQEYLKRLLVDFGESEKVLRKDIGQLRNSADKLLIGMKPLSKSVLTKDDHHILFEAVGQSGIVGRFNVIFGTVKRKTSFTVSTRIDDKSAKTVTVATIALLAPFKGAVITLTADNGKEFAYHEQMTESLKCDVYFTGNVRPLNIFSTSSLFFNIMAFSTTDLVKCGAKRSINSYM